LKQSGRVCKYKIKVKSKTSIENECGRDENSKLGLEAIHNYNPTSILRITKIEMPDSKNLVTEKTPLFTPKIKCLHSSGGCKGDDYGGGSKCNFLEVAQSSVWNTYCSVHGVGDVYDSSLDLAKVSPAFFALRFLSDQKLYPEQSPSKISVVDVDAFPNKTPIKTATFDGVQREVYNIPYNKISFKRPIMITRTDMPRSFNMFSEFGVYTDKGIGQDETICRAKILPTKKTMRDGRSTYGYIDNYDRYSSFDFYRGFLKASGYVIDGINTNNPKTIDFTMYETEYMPPFTTNDVYLQGYNTSQIYKNFYIKNKYIISD
jgi:hypothetical protein